MPTPAASLAANKTNKYRQISATQFTPVAIKTIIVIPGTIRQLRWSRNWWATIFTGDSRETTYLFKWPLYAKGEL